MNPILSVCRGRVAWLLAGVVLAAGCTPDGKPPEPAKSSSAMTREAVLARGHDLYRQHCAACHGAMAQGAPNWHKLGPDKKFPPSWVKQT